MFEEYDTLIAPVVSKEWASSVASGSSVKTKKGPDASFRARVARETFASLSSSEKERYASTAKIEAAAARAAYEEALRTPASQSPEARQEAIDKAGTFVAPFLQGITEITGLHGVLLLGGPMPRYGGDLRTLHVSYGRNKTAAAAHFPVWAKERFNGVIDLMKEYLQTAFDADDIKASALPTGLEGAKYTIGPNDSGSDSGPNDTDDSDSDEEEAPLRKRQKRNTHGVGDEGGKESKGKGKEVPKSKDAKLSKNKDAKVPAAAKTAKKRVRVKLPKPVASVVEPVAPVVEPAAVEPEGPPTPRRSGRIQTAAPTTSSADPSAARPDDSGSGSDSDSAFGSDSDSSDTDTESDLDTVGLDTVGQKRKAKDERKGKTVTKRVKTAEDNVATTKHDG
ncbi:hypothetical protein DFH06DRAFT_1341736, partial [Mycena polygramma]